MSNWSIGVVIPARNEADRIEACLDALRRAVERVRPRVRDVAAVVVADSCQDATAPLASAALRGWGEVVTVEVGGPGAARAAGVHRVLHRHAGARDRLWLASTDADTVVPETWLEHQLDLAQLGVAAVAGIVSVDSFAEHPPQVPERWSALYDGPVDAPHPHVHGANLGVRADAYVAVGGWEVLDCGEDHRLWRALRDAGFTVASPRSLVVTTSGRSTSRVEGGFADSLNVLAEAS